MFSLTARIPTNPLYEMSSKIGIVLRIKYSTSHAHSRRRYRFCSENHNIPEEIKTVYQVMELVGITALKQKPQ